MCSILEILAEINFLVIPYFRVRRFSDLQKFGMTLQSLQTINSGNLSKIASLRFEEIQCYCFPIASNAMMAPLKNTRKESVIFTPLHIIKCTLAVSVLPLPNAKATIVFCSLLC